MFEFESGKRREASRAAVRRRILAIVRDHGPISRIEIIRLSRMRPTTVSAVVGWLLKDGFVMETEKVASSGGRRPILIDLNPKSNVAIGIHVSRHGIRAATVNLRGEMIDERQQTLIFSGARRVTAAAIEFVREIIRSLKITSHQLIGVGLATPGLVDDRKGIAMVYTDNGAWKQIAFRRELEKSLSTRVCVENDTRALAMAEQWQTSGPSNPSMVYVEYSEGIAMSLVINGEFYRGADGFAGELGHMALDPRGPACVCGRHGCLERLTSIQTLADTINKRHRCLGLPPRLNRFSSIEDLIKICRSDSVAAKAASTVAGRHLGPALVNIAHLLNPRRIVIGGVLGEALGEHLLPVLKRFFRGQAMPPYVQTTDIIVSRQGQNATAVGAALMMMRAVFNWNNIQIQAKGDEHAKANTIE